MNVATEQQAQKTYREKNCMYDYIKILNFYMTKNDKRVEKIKLSSNIEIGTTKGNFSAMYMTSKKLICLISKELI